MKHILLLSFCNLLLPKYNLPKIPHKLILFATKLQGTNVNKVSLHINVAPRTLSHTLKDNPRPSNDYVKSRAHPCIFLNV